MYKIIGADGKEYGPVTSEQLRQWIADGRANRQTQVLLEGETVWRTLGEMPEFAVLMPSAPPPPSTGSLGAAPIGAAPIGIATDQVNGPGIGLIVTGILDILLSAFRIVAAVIGLGAAQQTGNPQLDKIMSMSGPIGGAIGLLGIVCGIVILMGGIKMRKLQSRGLCMTAAILAMIPCTSPCCLIGIPIGIWALVAMSKPEVKNSFN